MMSTCKLLCASLTLYSSLSGANLTSKDEHDVSVFVPKSSQDSQSSIGESDVSVFVPKDSHSSRYPVLVSASEDTGPGVSFYDYGLSYCLRILRSFEMESSSDNACYGTVIDGSLIDYTDDDSWLVSHDDDSLKLVYEDDESYKLGLSFNHGSTEHGHRSLSLELLVEGYAWLKDESKLVVEFEFDDCGDDSSELLSHSYQNSKLSEPSADAENSQDEDSLEATEPVSVDTTSQETTSQNGDDIIDSKVSNSTSADGDFSLTDSKSSNSTSADDDNESTNSNSDGSNDGSQTSSGDSDGSNSGNSKSSSGSGSDSSGSSDSGSGDNSSNGKDSESAHESVQLKLAEMFASFRSQVDCGTGELDHLGSAVCDQTNGESFKFAVVLDNFGECSAVTSSEAMVLDGGKSYSEDDEDSARSAAIYGVVLLLSMVLMLL